MFAIIVGLLVFVLLAVILGWLTLKAWGVRRGWVKWLGALLAGFFTLVFALLTVLGTIGTYKLFRVYNVALPQVTMDSSSEQIARGEHLAEVLCASCHSLTGDLPLSGGKNLSDDAGLPLGDIYAPNITAAGDIKDMSDAELFRLLRTGVNKEGRATSMTAILGPRALSDEDTSAVIAFLRQSAGVEGESPKFNPSILMALFAGAGLIPLDVPTAVNAVSAPPKAANAAYGEYVLAYMDCQSCHGVNLDGNVPPPYPPAPDIRPILSILSWEEFFNLVQANASAAQPGEVMPWKTLARLDDVELEALYRFLHESTSK